MILDLNSLTNKQLHFLNKLSFEIKTDYNSLIEKIYSKSNKKIGWIVNSILSRNPYVSDLFINILYLEFIRLSINENGEINKIILVDDSIYKVLNQYFEDNKYDIEVNFKKTSNKYFLKGTKSFIKNIYYTFLLLLNKSRLPANLEVLDKNIKLIDVFFVL